MDKYVPIYHYARKTGYSAAEIYRLIREKRFAEGEVKTIEKNVKRLVILRTAKLPKRFYKIKNPKRVSGSFAK